ncbi:nucleotidyltransferase family protein [Prevotella sp. S7-1-8]|uniref:nucleotidyltransferase domain-containing protein n=1 Tax=Prevotella sp. S7-1-8 TaxID=1284775 RepID=UPI00056774AB|nr:nucleotidyltransferase family protein [Prevotella sp. S7-1-8]
MSLRELFFKLIRSELWQEELPSGMSIDHDKFQKLMAMAQKQTVEGLVSSAFMRNNVSLGVVDAVRLLSVSASIVKANKNINNEVKALCAMLSGRDVKYFLVKGQTLAMLYPHPEARVCGDIDFYVFPEFFEEVVTLIEKEWQITIKRSEEDEQHVSFERHGVVFEMHYCLMKFSSSRNQKEFDRMIHTSSLSYRYIDGVRVPILDESLNLAYTFLHLYHHLIEIGVGLRQFCDVAMIMKSMDMDAAQKKRVVTILRKLDFEKAFHVIELILNKYLGLDDGKLILPKGNEDSKYVEFFMRIVFKRGNFGKYGRKNAVRSGWKYNCEVFAIKVKHYGRTVLLSPRENIAFIFKQLPKKIISMA